VNINPEFRRNVWVQFTWMRLLAAPLLTLIACYVFLLFFSPAWLQRVAEFVGGTLIIGLWGTRRVADSLAEEVSDGTWEGQRMSGLGAWQMTWGKLIGSASFVWYCGLIALAVVLWASNRAEALGQPVRPPLAIAFNMLLGGLTAQAAAFAMSLILMRKAAQFRRLTITLAQTCGFLIYVAVGNQGMREAPGGRFSSSGLGGGGFGGGLDLTALPGAGSPLSDFGRMLLVAIACGWTVVAAYRLMRTELQYRSLPWVWTAFVAFILIWTTALADGTDVAPALLPAFCAMVLLTYLSFFADYRDPVRYRWALVGLRQGKWFEVVSAVPWWLISFVVAAALALTISWSSPAPGDLGMGEDARPVVAMLALARQRLPESLLLVVLFMLRDLLVLLWLSCSPWRAKADVAGIIYLLLVYCPLAAILWVAGGQYLLPVVLPIASGTPAVDYVPIAIELAFAAFLFYARWREITKLKR
jgi:hypothetical protein